MCLVVGLAAMACPGCEAEPEAPAPNVLLITLDTLRPDWIHAYGFARENTPAIDRLASRGVVFENAIAAASLTAPAHASILTGRYAREHSVGTLNGESRLEGLKTLAQHFTEGGYETAAFVSNVVLRRRIGLDLGFEVYDDELAEQEENRPAFFERAAERTAQRALAWIAERSAARPYLLWLHLQDPHGPYTPPAEFAGRVGAVPLRMRGALPVLPKNTGRAGIPAYQALPDIRDPADYAGRYAEEIMYADFWLGRVVEAFEEQSANRGAVVLLTADHGESLGEQGYFFQHGQSILPELVRVPLIVVAPGVSSRRMASMVSHVDILPTLVELAGLSRAPDTSGISLVPALQGQLDAALRPIFSDTEGEAGLYGPDRLTRVLGPGLMHRGEVAQGSLQYETLARNAKGDWRPAPLDEAAMEKLLEYIEAEVPLVPVGLMEPEHIEQLRALGYLAPEGSGEAGAADPAQRPSAGTE